MSTDAKQAQRVLLKGKKLIGLEQVQQVVVHEAEGFRGHIEEAYHICKLEGKPVFPAVCKELTDCAVRSEPTHAAAARVLGVNRSTITRHVNAGNTLIRYKGDG